MLAFFAIFRPLIISITLQKHFYLVEEVLSFDLVGHMWKSVKNWLQEWVFNIYKWKSGRSRWIVYFENYLQKQQENLAGNSWNWYGECPTAFPTRFSHKNFPQDFPKTISHKIFPQQFPTKFSRKIFLQQFPARFFHNNFLQDFPATISCNNFLQDFPTRISRKNFLQHFPTRISHKNFPQHFPTFFQAGSSLVGSPSPYLNFHQWLPFLNWLFPLLHFPQDFPARISRKNFLQDFPTRFSWAGSWLVCSPSPYSKC